MASMVSTLRASHAFNCVEVHVDGKRVGGNSGTFLRVEVDSICKEVLAIYLQNHAPDYYPLPDDVKVTMMCTKISDTVQGRAASDVGTVQDCSVFLDFPLSMAMSEVPTKRFMFKCFRPVETRRPRVDAFNFLMAASSQTTAFVHLPPFRAPSVMTARDVLCNDLR